MKNSLVAQLREQFDPARPTPVRRLALVGVAKNCGKTTTLNFLTQSGACRGRTVGLVSIGIDGEVADLLLGTEKPPIYVRAGDWVVTARDVLVKSTARIEYVASMGFSTPLGEVICGRVIEGGRMVLAGLRHRADLLAACEVLESNGVDLVLIDGAYGRTVAAGGGVSDAVIVSTGAVISAEVDVICARTAALVERLAPAPITLKWQADLMRKAVAQDRFLLGGEGIEDIRPDASSALIGLRQVEDLWQPEVEAVAIPGLVSDGIIEALLAAPTLAGQPPRALLIPDGTVLQAKSRLIRRLRRTWDIRALGSARILALSFNPTGIQGHAVDAEKLGAACRKRWPDLIVFDPETRLPAPASSAVSDD